LAILAIYGSTLGYELVWDDHYLILRNQMLLPANAHLIWSTPFWQLAPNQPPEVEVGFVRPLVTSDLFLERRLFDATAWPYHATSLLLYIACVLLALRILRYWLNDQRWALAGALLFALHPLHIEAVTFVTGRTDLWVGVFILAAGAIWSRPYNARAGLTLQRWRCSTPWLCSPRRTD